VLAALLRSASVFVGTDSGPAHLAEAMGTKTVRLFGPTDPGRWGPLDRQRHSVVTVKASCAPCGFTDCPTDHHCMNAIQAHMPVEAALRLLQQPITQA
jgi:ADP-heptose:LPS heptosyltransferase